MRAQEFVTEAAVGSIHIGPVEIVVDDHAVIRAQERGVDPRAVDYVMRRQLPKVIKQLSQVESGQKVWVYDWSRETALGLRRISADDLKFVLKTVWPGAPAMTPGTSRIIKT